MKRYKTGTVFELNENEEYMIIDNMEIEKRIYILAAPIYNENKIIKADYSKTLLLKIDKNNDEMEIETDEKIIEKVINNTINRL